ncbi:LCP family protein [Schnuerera sp. xch1]|uniref:LCP family protein n=1 Tax=Schnuerera sp. xch1 TaxID=2874283 RepID=UPI001CBB9CCF|nr:LCP family protein [Schnuerera sp. xch1]MBZ2175360.1 LCP family protein [Schnuerera sp. xch1]
MKGRFFKTFFVSFILFAVLWTGFIYKTVILAESEEAEYEEGFIDRLINGDDDITFLLLGVDSNDVAKSSGTRTDTMMVCKVDKSTGDISMLSIPRDTKVRIRGRKNEDKINHAHAYGGAELSVKAVKDLLGIDLDYYVKVDYKIVKEFVDLIGGVEVDVPMDMKYNDPIADPPLYINLSKGRQVLNGDKSLQFLRFRKGYANQDLGRIESQQQFIKAAFEQALTVDNIDKIPQMIKSYYNNVDTNIPLDLILKFAAKAKDYNMEGIQTATLPGEPQYVNGVSYYVSNEEETNKLVDELFINQKTAEHIDNNSGSNK